MTAARVQDRDGGKLVLKRIDLRYPRLRRIWADGAYQAIVAWARWTRLAVLEIMQRTSKGSRCNRSGGSWSGRSPGWGGIAA